ncbi:MAG: copper amine oxidase N-terminal domain-containing protein [Peptostreptococcaceae bacterium]|nr:copper amine oxidase N-terminal domain-containing protein [Peptostreptococcaceae bacterium]
MKKLLSLMTATFMLTSTVMFSTPSYADEMQKKINSVAKVSYAEGLTVQIYDKIISGNAKSAIVKDGRTMLPFRAVFEGLGAKVDFDKNSKQIHAAFDNMEIMMTIGSTKAVVKKDGQTQEVMLGSAPFTHKGQNFVPVRDIANMTGLTVEYSKYDEKVNIYDKQKFFDDINKNFTIYNSILKKGVAQQNLKKTLQTNAEFSADFQILDENQMKKAGGKLSFDGLTRAMDVNGKFKLEVNFGDFEKDILENATDREKELINALKKSEHEIIYDSDKAVMYLKSELASKILEKESGSWLKTDSQSGISSALTNPYSMNYMDELMKNPEKLTLAELLYQSMESQKETFGSTYASTTYDQVQEASKVLMFFMGDDGFVQNGSSYTLSLDKKGIVSRLMKYAPDLHDASALLSMKEMNYKLTLLNTDSDNLGIEMLISGVIASSSGDTKFSFNMKGDQHDAKIAVNVEDASFGKLIVNADVKTKETSQAIQLTPPQGAKIVSMEE